MFRPLNHISPKIKTETAVDGSLRNLNTGNTETKVPEKNQKSAGGKKSCPPVRAARVSYSIKTHQIVTASNTTDFFDSFASGEK